MTFRIVGTFVISTPFRSHVSKDSDAGTSEMCLSSVMYQAVEAYGGTFS